MARIKFSWRKTWQDKTIPTRENCDPLNPRQALLPAFTGFGVKGAPLMLPTDFFEELSEHIVEFLGVPVVETIERVDGKKQKVRRLEQPLQVGPARRKYIPPATVMNRAEASGGWVTMDTPDPERKPISETFAELPHQDQVALTTAVLEMIGAQQANSEPPSRVISVFTLAQQLTVEPDHLVQLLTAWGVPDVATGSMLDRQTALRIAAHYNRAVG